MYHVPPKLATETPAAELRFLRAKTASTELNRNPRRDRLRRRRVFYALNGIFPRTKRENKLLWEISAKRWTNRAVSVIIVQRLWRDVRAVECARLESGYTERYRRFKSCSLRQEESRLNTRLFYFCLKGVAGIVFQTKQYQIKRSDHYLTQKRDAHGNFIK